MTIPLVREPEDEADNVFGGIVEGCHFCNTPTKFWNENTNNPVCRPCARRHRVGELPDHGRNVRKAKRKAARAAKES